MKLYSRIKWQILYKMQENSLTEDDLYRLAQEWTVLALAALGVIFLLTWGIMLIGSML